MTNSQIKWRDWLRGRPALFYFAVMIWLLNGILPAVAAAEKPHSSPGKYLGYSKPIYHAWIRTSQYIVVRDGARLAADIFRPAHDGQPVSDPLPVVWTFDRYHRADRQNGLLSTQLEEEPWLTALLKHGYVVGVVDIKGTGASFGSWKGMTEREALDGYDVTEWFAAQPWCNQRVGMFGRSYMGITQYMIAATKPPHLRAIFPEMAMFDLYSLIYTGGVFQNNFVSHWNQLVRRLDLSLTAVPVDEDPGGDMLARAIEMHKSNLDVYGFLSSLPYRDSLDPVTGKRPYFSLSPSSYIDKISESGVAVYHLSGWFDIWSRDAFLWFSNLKNPQKIVIGPWAHTSHGGFDLEAEHLRWYDYWLKGINNGIMDEPPIYYYTIGAPYEHEWRAARRWPLPEQQSTRYYFGEKLRQAAGSGGSALLDTTLPTNASGQDDYLVDYTTTSGVSSRWAAGYGGGFRYQDMTNNDAKGVTYTTPPLDSELEVTGHPVAHLWISAKVKDADIFVYLEEVTSSERSLYVSEGVIRASHRALSDPGFAGLSLPFHRSFKADLIELRDEPVELVFDLLPTSYRFKTGNRIRVTITGADSDNFLTPRLSTPPVISILRNARNASYIDLPVIPLDRKETAVTAPSTTGFLDTGYGLGKLILIFLSSVTIITVLVLLFIKWRKNTRAF